jgi:hypothetical protein
VPGYRQWGPSEGRCLLLMMIMWANWNERNVRTFRYKSTLPIFIFNSISQMLSLGHWRARNIWVL